LKRNPKLESQGTKTKPRKRRQKQRTTSCLIVERNYVLILRRVLNDLSLVELVASITKTSFNTFTTSDSKSHSTTVEAKSKTWKSRDKDEAKKTETETTNNIQKLKENTQKTKSKRATRTPPKTIFIDQSERQKLKKNDHYQKIWTSISCFQTTKTYGS
jgi:hypothetical protein